MTGGLIALAVAVAAATMLGVALRCRSGRFRAGPDRLGRDVFTRLSHGCLGRGDVGNRNYHPWSQQRQRVTREHSTGETGPDGWGTERIPDDIRVVWARLEWPGRTEMQCHE